MTLAGELKPSGALHLAHGAIDGEVTARWQNVVLGPGVKSFGELQPVKPAAGPAQPAASITNHGRGKIAAIYFTAGQVYTKDHPPVLRDFLAAVTRELFPQPMVEVTGTHDVDVTVSRQPGKLLVHLINTSGPHATQPIQESIAPLGSLEITLRLAQKPARITLEPGARSVPFTYRDRQARLTVPGVAIYDVLAVQEP